MRKSNCCKAELLPRTVLCSKCLSEVKVKKLTAEDFIKDNVLNLPFKETLSEVSSIACNSPRFNKTLIIKFELDKDGTYKYNLPEDMDKVRVEQRASYVVKYGKHVNKIKSLDETNLTFSVRGNQIVINSYEFTKLKKSDLVLTFKYAKKNETHSKKIDMGDREKRLKSFIYNLNINGLSNLSKDRNKILKSNVDFLKLLSYADVNLHVTKFIDLGNDEVHVEFGIAFLPSTKPSVFTFITKWDYLNQILIKKMTIPTPKDSLNTLPLPIKIGDKVLFQNRHVLLKYFNIGYHALNNAFGTKYIIQNIHKIEDLFILTISDNYNLYESHLLSLVDVFALFGSANTEGAIVNPDQQYGRAVTPTQPEPCQFGPTNINPGYMGAGQIHSNNMESRYNLDGMGYFKAKSRPNFEINAIKDNKSIMGISTVVRDDSTLKTVVELGNSVTVNKDVFYRSLFTYPDGKIDEIFNNTRTFKVIGISTNGHGYILTLSNGDISLVTVVLSIAGIENFFIIGKGKGFTPGFTHADESGFFKTDGTTDKKFDEPIKDEKIVPARIDEPNLFSNGDYVLLKEKTIREGIAKGFIKDPFGSIFKGDKCFKILNTYLNTLTAEHRFVFGDSDAHLGFTIEADRVNEVITKVPLPNATFNILDKITEKVDMIDNSEQREELERTVLAKYPLGSMLHISKKNFMAAVSDGYITGHFGLDLDSDTFLEIINVAVNPILKRVSFTLRKNNVNCGFTIDIDKVGVVTHKPIETKVNKPRTKKTETKK